MKGIKRKPSKSNDKKPANRRRSLSYEKLTKRAQAAYNRTTAFVTDVRSGKGPKNKLLREHHLSWQTAQKYGGRDLLGGTRGKPVRASKADRRVRNLLFPDSSGDVRIRTRSSRDASAISDYYNDREKLLGNKISPEEFENKWSGVKVAGRELFADTDHIFRMEDAGILNLKDLYSDGGPEK